MSLRGKAPLHRHGQGRQMFRGRAFDGLWTCDLRGYFQKSKGPNEGPGLQKVMLGRDAVRQRDWLGSSDSALTFAPVV